jgi:hypothetical protein
VERFRAFWVKVKSSANVDYGSQARTGKPNQISRHQVDPLMQIAIIGSYQWSLQAGLTTHRTEGNLADVDRNLQ